MPACIKFKKLCIPNINIVISKEHSLWLVGGGGGGAGVKGWGLTLVYLKILLRLRALGHTLHNTHFPEELYLSRKIKIASYPPHSISTMKIQNYLHCRRSHS